MKRAALAFKDALEGLAEKASLPFQQEAWQRFLKRGLPTRKTEGFQKLPLHHLYQQEFSLEEAGEQVANNLPQGVTALPLTQAYQSYGALLYNTLQKTDRLETDPFTLLTAALSQSGRFLYVPPNTVLDQPIELSFQGPAFHQTFLYVGAGSRVSLIIHGPKLGFFNHLLDIVGAEGAEIEVTQNTLEIPSDSCYLDAMRVSLKKDCKFKNIVITRGSKLMRHYTQVKLLSQGAEAHIFGAALLSGCRHSEQRLRVDHQAPASVSSHRVKNVLSGESRSSVQSAVMIEPNALKSSASQLNHNLLLTDNAQASAKPHMEILADDVKASHGATFGQLDDEQLIYFQTRGIPDTLAKNLLVLGFCKEIFDEISCRTIRNQAATKGLALMEEQ